MDERELEAAFDEFEREMASLSASMRHTDLEGNLELVTVLDRVNLNLAIARESDKAWWKKLAWMVNVRQSIFAIIGQLTLSEWLDAGMEL